jgi:mono/diheme cytochrome c family protein
MAWTRVFVVLGAAGAVGAALLLSVPAAQAQSGGGDAQVKRGQMLYQNRGCAGCHGVIGAAKGTQGAAPDLAGITARRSNEWLTRWLKNTAEMLATDSTAINLMKQYHLIKMPTVKLSDDDIGALLAFIKTKGG